MLLTKETATKPIKDLMEYFKLKEVHTREWRDRYGIVLIIEELGLECYKRDLKVAVEHLISQYDYATSDEALKLLKKVERSDNHYARFINKREYEIIKVEMNKDICVKFGVLIRFKDNGEERHFIETGLDYALRDKEKLEKYIRKVPVYWTAGGIEDSKVDFIFNGVGFSTKYAGYQARSEIYEGA